MKNAMIASLVLLTLSFSSCFRKVTRIDPNQQVDLSGRWNNTDSKLVAEEMIGDVFKATWLQEFTDKNPGKKPTVIAGFVKNKSHEHIEAETFIKDLESEFIKTQKVRLVQGGEKREEIRAERADQQDNASASTMKKWGLEIGADYMLQGSINSIVDSYKAKFGRSKKVVYYQIDLELTNIQTNEVVWIGTKKISKFVTN